MPGIWRTPHTAQKDARVVRDRLHPQNNPARENDSFLDAVGAVWTSAIRLSAVGYGASSGFLIDRCHALTAMHVVYGDDIVVNPAPGQPVMFGVGQTQDNSRGALQGLRFLLHGAVVAHGDTTIVDHRVQNPDNDWALIGLTANVDASILPMSLAAVDPGQLPPHMRLAAAGFPTDHRDLRANGFNLKDLWGAEGQLVAVVATSTIGALIETTIQATRGDSGGPVYGDIEGQRHVVIGLMQSVRGNGIDVSDTIPNTQVLFTPSTMASIRAAQAQTPCR